MRSALLAIQDLFKISTNGNYQPLRISVLFLIFHCGPLTSRFWCFSINFYSSGNDSVTGISYLKNNTKDKFVNVNTKKISESKRRFLCFLPRVEQHISKIILWACGILDFSYVIQLRFRVCTPSLEIAQFSFVGWTFIVLVGFEKIICSNVLR